MTDNISLKQVNRFLLCGVLLCIILYFAKSVLIPLTFSAFFAMLFTPLSNRMEKIGIKRVFSALISILILLIAVTGIGLLVFLESKKLAAELPEIEKKAVVFMADARDYITNTFNISESEQKEIIQQQIKSVGDSFGKALQGFLAGTFGFIAASVLVLILTFLFLLQRGKYETFFLMIITSQPPAEAKKTIAKITLVAQSYLTGRALSVLLFTALFTIGFMIVGLKSAFLLAFIAALLTIIPYVGSIIGGIFPFVVALVTQDSSNVAFGALLVVLIIQGIDNYFIEPYIIGGEVNISAFFSILILLIGGLLWGVAGMILFLPMLGVTKIIFDAIPQLNAYGYLIGDQQKGKPSTRLWKKIKGIFKKKAK